MPGPAILLRMCGVTRPRTTSKAKLRLAATSPVSLSTATVRAFTLAVSMMKATEKHYVIKSKRGGGDGIWRQCMPSQQAEMWIRIRIGSVFRSFVDPYSYPQYGSGCTHENIKDLRLKFPVQRLNWLKSSSGTGIITYYSFIKIYFFSRKMFYSLINNK